MSEIRVDTISEKTSANGVAVDGVTLKDGQVDLADSKKVLLGNSDDLQLYHDGTDSIINNATGTLKVQADTGRFQNAAGNETIFGGTADGAAFLVHNDATKITTTANGVTVTDGILVSGTTPSITIGDGGAEDTKLLFDGNAQNFYIGIDDSADDLLIGLGSTVGTTPAIAINENNKVTLPDGQMEIIVSGNYANLTLTTTDADDNFGPELRLYRNSSSPANADNIGLIDFEGKDSGGDDELYARIASQINDKTDGQEDGILSLQVMIAGTIREAMRISDGGIVFNELSQDMDFRVESNDLTHMVFVNAGSNEIGFGSGNDYSARVLAHQSAADHQALNVEGQNSSYASTALNVAVTRNSSNAYNFIKCEARGFANKFIVRDDGLVSAVTTTIASISDERIKQDITDANSQWDDIKALKFKNFRKKTAVRNEGDDALKELGVIAQDVEDAGMTGLIDYADPDTGHVKDDATFGTLYTQADEDAGNIPSGHFVHQVKEVKEQVKMVKYSIIWMKAMKALQEAQTRIETLESKVTALES